MCFWWQYCTADTICTRERDKQSLVKCLVFCSQTVIKDVVVVVEEEEMWSPLTGKIKLNAGGAEDIRKVRENKFPLRRSTTVHLSVIHTEQELANENKPSWKT